MDYVVDAYYDRVSMERVTNRGQGQGQGQDPDRERGGEEYVTEFVYDDRRRYSKLYVFFK